jgi:hypothetical protein
LFAFVSPIDLGGVDASLPKPLHVAPVNTCVLLRKQFALVLRQPSHAELPLLAALSALTVVTAGIRESHTALK